MFYGGMAGAAVTLVIAITVYIKLNIAQVITDLTGWNWPGAGRKARKSTSKQTDTSTKPTTKEIHVRKNVEKEVAAGEYVEPTEKMASGKMDPTALLSQESFKKTALLKQEGLDPTALLTPDGLEPTALLTPGGHEATGLLTKAGHEPAALQFKTPKREPVAAAVSAGRDYSPDSPTETTILSEWNETNVLTADPDETTLLNETTLLDDIDETTLLTEEEPRFQKQVDIMIVHSNTII
jgi:hypothetical protein